MLNKVLTTEFTLGGESTKFWIDPNNNRNILCGENYFSWGCYFINVKKPTKDW